MANPENGNFSRKVVDWLKSRFGQQTRPDHLSYPNLAKQIDAEAWDDQVFNFITTDGLGAFIGSNFQVNNLEIDGISKSVSFVLLKDYKPLFHVMSQTNPILMEKVGECSRINILFVESSLADVAGDNPESGHTFLRLPFHESFKNLSFDELTSLLDNIFDQKNIQHNRQDNDRTNVEGQIRSQIGLFDIPLSGPYHWILELEKFELLDLPPNPLGDFIFRWTIEYQTEDQIQDCMPSYSDHLEVETFLQ